MTRISRLALWIMVTKKKWSDVMPCNTTRKNLRRVQRKFHKNNCSKRKIFLLDFLLDLPSGHRTNLAKYAVLSSVREVILS